MKLNFLLPRCERCDRRLGPSHDPKVCVKRSLNRRHFLMAGAGAVIGSAVAAIVRPLPLYGNAPFQITPQAVSLCNKVEAALNSNKLRAAMRAEWAHMKRSLDLRPMNKYQVERLDLAPRASLQGASIHCPQIEGPDVVSWEVRRTLNGYTFPFRPLVGGNFTKVNVG